MHDPIKRRKKRGKLYFSSKKALRTSRMGKKKVAPERFETEGINKVLDFEDTGDNATLSTVDESEGPSMERERESQSQEQVGTNPASNPASEQHSVEEDCEETSLMEPEGMLRNPYPEYCSRIILGAQTSRVLKLENECDGERIRDLGLGSSGCSSGFGKCGPSSF